MTNRLNEPKSDDTNAGILILQKGDQHWIFMFRDSMRVELLRQMGRMAADPELSFSWYDCAILSKRIRETADNRSDHGK